MQALSEFACDYSLQGFRWRFVEPQSGDVLVQQKLLFSFEIEHSYCAEDEGMKGIGRFCIDYGVDERSMLLFDENNHVAAKLKPEDMNIMKPVTLDKSREKVFHLHFGTADYLKKTLSLTCCCNTHRNEVAIQILKLFHGSLSIDELSPVVLKQFVVIHEGTGMVNSAPRHITLCGSSILLFMPPPARSNGESGDFISAIPLCRHLSCELRPNDKELILCRRGTDEKKAPDVISFLFASILERNMWVKALHMIYERRGQGELSLSIPPRRASLFGRLRGHQTPPRRQIPSRHGSFGGGSQVNPSDSAQSLRDAARQHLFQIGALGQSPESILAHDTSYSHHLRQQENFFAFFYQKLHHQTILLETSFAGKESMASLTAASSRRGSSSFRDVAYALLQYHIAVKESLKFLRQSYVLCKDSGHAPDQSIMSFSFPGYNTQMFSLGGYAVVQCHKLFGSVGPDPKFSARDIAYCDETWNGALSSKVSVGKELMISIADVKHLMEHGHMQESKSILKESTDQVLVNLSITQYIAKTAPTQSMNRRYRDS